MCIEWNDDWLIKYIYEHKNSNNMNEYRGFKVGDRVEITFSSAHPIKGTITSFGDRKLGGFAEPDTMDVWISETTRYDMIYLVSHDLIKKLPKYAVGDVVRFKHKTGKNPTVVDKYGFIATIKGCDVHENICTLYEYPENYTECCFEPFDGFRVGDTVWTVKRGKGKIVCHKMYPEVARPFFVLFDNKECDRNPKTSNLIPTESLYKEALNKTGYAFKIDVAVVEEYDPKDSVAKHFEKIEKAAQAMNLIHSAAKIWANAFGRTTDQIKFPSGGVVFSGGTGVHGEYCEPFAKPLHTNKPTYTRCAEGKLEFVAHDDSGTIKYFVSKFAVHELVSYAGCIRAVVDKIHFKDGKFTYDLRTSSCPEGLPEDSLSAVAPSAKFKAGDVVYFKNIGHSLCATENPNKYIVISPNAAGGFVTLKRWDNEAAATCRESDLRLWVETKFSYILGSRVGIISMSQIDMKSIKYMGKSVVPPDNIEYGDDVFLGKTASGKDIILFGIKGDDWV